jgi:hypothetical protein
LFIKYLLSCIFVFLTFFCLLNTSCGIPDFATPLNEIKVTEISDTIFTLESNDLKVDGNVYNNYGIDIYYKIYKKNGSIDQLNSDFQKIVSSSLNYQTLLEQNGFLHIADNNKTDSDNKLSPVYTLSSDWTITIDFSTGYKKVISIYNGSKISGNAKSYYRYTSSYKSFSPDQLISSNDTDLVAYRGDKTFNSNDACFGIIFFAFAQDFEKGYVPQYSTPKLLGPFDIK